MATSWIVKKIKPPDQAKDEESSSIKRLKILANRLRNVLTTCSHIMGHDQMEGEPAQELDVALNKLQVATENFDSEIREQTKENHPDSNLTLDNFYSLLFEAQDMLSTLKVYNQRLKEIPPSDHSNTTSRLPQLDMMKFDGDRLKWTEFWDSFSASIDKRSDLSNVDKFTYLNGLLEKEAREAVRGLPITNRSYVIAIEELKDQFGKPEVIVDAHYRALNKLPPAGADIIACRRTRAEIERHLKVLSAMGEPVDSNNQLRSMIMDKFPENILYNLRMVMKAKGCSVATVRQGLKDIISATDESVATPCNSAGMEMSNKFTTEVLFSSSKTDDKPNNSHENTNKWKPAEKRSSTSKDREPPKKKFLKGCIFCDGPHFNERCSKYRTLEERMSKLQDRCIICLFKGHNSFACKFANGRKCWHCKQNTHNRCICPTLFKDKVDSTTTLYSHTENSTILQTATANIHHANETQEIQARLLFDTGSQKSYVTEKLAKALKLDTVEDLALSIYTFGTPHPAFIKTRLVNLNIQNSNGTNISVSALVMPTITGPLPAFKAIKDNIKVNNPSKRIASDSDEDCPADILIGNDNYHSFFTGATEKIGDNLFLLQSKLGWIISGKTNSYKKGEVLSFLTYVKRAQGRKKQQFTVPDPPLQDDRIRDLWELECIGIRDSPKIMEEDEIVKLFTETTKFYNKRYYVKWPWSQYPSDLPVNFGMALGRLNGLLKRTEITVLLQYNQVLQDQLSKGMIEVIQDKELPQHAVHYLPHHCIVQEGKTTNLRIVYDASSKATGHCSLNEYLYKGPMLLEDLVALLLAFRTHSIGIVADVEKAFLQIGLQKEDRDVTRFLWVRDIHKEAKGDNIVHLRFCRVPFGIISSPFLLAATVKHHLLQQKSPIALKISQSLYVDNLVTGTTTVQSAVELYNTAKASFEGLSMNIREWDSNSDQFLKKIPPEQKTKGKSSYTSVLGLKWDTNQDSLMLAFDPKLTIKPVSCKREILRIIASVYDPCGLVAPLLLPAKIFLQKLWLEKFKWDTILPTDKIEEWNKHATPLRFIGRSSVPRYFFEGPRHREEVLTQSTLELHCFCDASSEAYSALVYTRSVKTGETVTNLAMSRTRLIPIKNRDLMTTPKRELLGVLIGARLIRYVNRTLNLPITSMFLWTDSKIVLGWLKSTNLLQPFVSKRITEISSLADIRFRYVPSGDNPADIATRSQYSPLPWTWFHGPQFLMLPDDKWPVTDNVEKPKSNHTNALPVQCELPDLDNDHETLSPQEIECSPHQSPSDDGLTTRNQDQYALQGTDILQPSEKETIKQLQTQYYPKELAGKSSPLTKSLGLFVDQSGVLRCSGRLQNSCLPYDQKHPILLPKTDPFTTNVITQLHVNNKHVGVSHTLSLLRRKYWVPQGRSKVEAVLKQCKQCVKYGGGPYKLPPMPPLPQERVRLCTPFTYTGLDYLGPLMVDEGGTTQKRWCCLFTCMASRAIRLEIVRNLTADEFLLCLRRFVAAQGPPLLIVSDNAAQFKLVAEVITSPLNETHKIAWHFIPELSPWQGGFYERLVSLVKHCLRRSLDKVLINETQLGTVLKEIETVLNSRPLTHVGTDLDIILTPSDFLNNCGTLPLIQSFKDQSPSITATKSDLIHSWSRGQTLLQEFTSLFQDRYLTNLRERAMATHRQHRIVSNLKPHIGAVVQIWDGRSKSSNRAHWKVGKISALIKSRDGLVRTAKVTLNSGETINRSISFLYPLELDRSPQYDTPTPEPAGNTEQTLGDHLTSPGSSAPLPSTTDECPNKGSLTTDSDYLQSADTNAPGDPGNTTQAVTDAQNLPASEHLPEIHTRPHRKAAEVAQRTIRQWTQDLLSLSAHS